MSINLYAAIAAVALGFAGASTANAIEVANGLSVNGLSVNGLSVNGLSVNGLSVNGLSVNGLSVNGLSVNGLSVNGLSVNGREMQGLVASNSDRFDLDAVVLSDGSLVKIR